jgi:hypothetical protein
MSSTLSSIEITSETAILNIFFSTVRSGRVIIAKYFSGTPEMSPR